MAELVYVLCSVTSFICAIMLYRKYARTHKKLLLWSAVCFFGLTLSSGLLVLDLVVFPGPTINLMMYRPLPSLIGLLMLIYGLVTEVT